LAQVVHLDVPAETLATWLRRHEPGAGPTLRAQAPAAALPGLARALSRRAGPEVRVWAAAVAPRGFDARYAACSRRYRYDVEPDGGRDPLRARLAWQLDGPVDVPAMRLGADPLVGEHDFAAFCRRPPDRPSGPLTRRVLDARWTVLSGPGLDGTLLRFEIEAAAFCHQMVRSIVGLLVAVGQGRARPSDVAGRLAAGSRLGNPPVAPAQGLCLVGVGYPEPFGSGLWGLAPGLSATGASL
jgi:tRNA pseudouridine38-40 synthase